MNTGMVAHSGDGPSIPLVDYGNPPANDRERLGVLQTMVAHTQFCMSGDHTVQVRPSKRKHTSGGDRGERYITHTHMETVLQMVRELGGGHQL